MFKRISRGPLDLKIWTDGYDNDPIKTATHVSIRTNVPDDPQFESETDHYVVDDDGGVAWMYAKGFVTRHGDHNHTQYVPLVDADFDVQDGEPVGDLTARVIEELFEKKDLVLKAVSIDRLTDDLGVDVPRSRDDFEAHRLDGYGFHEQSGVPVIVFAAPDTMPTPAQWEPPLTHVVNYTYGETEADAVQRFGVMGLENQIIGGWTGKTGFELVKRLTKHNEFEVAVRTVSDDSMPDITHEPAYEPRFLGDVEYGVGDEGLMHVDRSDWENRENESGVTAMEMWESVGK